MLADFVNQEKICQDSMVGSVIVPGEWNMHDTIHLCQGLGGQMSVVDSEKKQIFLSALFRNHSQCSQAGTVQSTYLSDALIQILSLKSMNGTGTVGGICPLRGGLRMSTMEKS